MFFISLLIYAIGFYLPSWITKKKVSQLRDENSWRQVFFELSGLITCFVFSFIIILILTFSVKEKYLLNKDLLYGIKTNELSKSWGFQDGDKIITINKKEVINFSDIMSDLLKASDKIEVKIERNDSIKIISLENSQIITDLFDSDRMTRPFLPKNVDKLVFRERSKKFADAIDVYKNQGKLISQFSPFSDSGYQGSGSFMSIQKINDFRGYMFLLSLGLFVLGWISFIPLPGFGLGNSIIVIIQKTTKKKIDQKKLKVLRILFQSIFIALLLFLYLWLVLF